MTDSNRDDSQPYPSPDAAIALLAKHTCSLKTETVGIDAACGRILRVPIVADRDSPAADVSAMDGYAIRLADLQQTEPLPVVGESRPGHAPPPADPVAAMRVFTGGIVPAGFDAVIRREDTEEGPATVRLLAAAQQAADGQHIRRRGENIRWSSVVLAAGTRLSSGSIAAAANFGASELVVSKRTRLTVIVTGDELRRVDERVKPWQLRDSNGHALAALLCLRPWIRLVEIKTCQDSLEAITKQLQQSLAESDAVVLTGGVSMGDYDHVPAAVEACGGNVHFHRLPLRPGKPILGAATDSGKLILGLPGNPVSATVCARRFLIPLLAEMAGQLPATPPRIRLADAEADPKTLPLWWMRLARIGDDGFAELVTSKGSGDAVSLARSDGFVEQGPATHGSGPWPWWSWND